MKKTQFLLMLVLALLVLSGSSIMAKESENNILVSANSHEELMLNDNDSIILSSTYIFPEGDERNPNASIILSSTVFPEGDERYNQPLDNSHLSLEELGLLPKPSLKQLGLDQIEDPILKEELLSNMFVPTAISGKYNTFVAPGTASYNCYGYAVGTYTWLWPGSLSQGSQTAWKGKTIYQVKELVKADLATLGYKVVDANINTPVYSGERLVALRKGYVNSTEDFHLMVKLPSSNSWTHKPGNTSILSSINGPGTSTWYPEYYNYNLSMWGMGTGGYTSPVVYFKMYKVSPGCVWNGHTWDCPMVDPNLPIEQ